MTEESRFICAETQRDQPNVWDISGRTVLSLDSAFATLRVDLQTELEDKSASDAIPQSAPGKLRCPRNRADDEEEAEIGDSIEDGPLPNFDLLLDDAEPKDEASSKPSSPVPFRMFNNETPSGLIEEEIEFLLQCVSNGTLDLEEAIRPEGVDEEENEDWHSDRVSLGRNRSLKSLIGMLLNGKRNVSACRVQFLRLGTW